MNFKKFLCLGLLILTVLALAACGPEEPPKDTYYTVTYDSDGGTAVTAQSIKENDKAIAPTAPTKKGYDFAGWYVGETAFNFDSAITADTALKAKWTKVSYQITYMDGETAIELTPNSYDVETDYFNLPEYSKPHYNFMGWYKDAEFSDIVSQVTKGTTGNLTFYAQFTLKNYGIAYHLDGGVNSDGNPATYNLGSTFPIAFTDPTKDGYKFVGWFDNALGQGDKITQIDAVCGDVTLHAVWEKEETVAPECEHIDADDNLACDKCGESFDDGENPDVIPEGTEFTIEYFDGESKLALEPGVYKYGEATELPIPEKAHYTFLGWYTTATFDEGTDIKSISATASDNLVLYAKFTPVEYKITYFLLGGTNAEGNPDTYTVLDNEFVFANPTKEGYKFEGWYTDPYFKNHIGHLNNKSGDLILFAKWTQVGQSGILTPEDKFN